MISTASVLKRGSTVRFRRVDREAVVLVQERSRVLGLNETGLRILELVDGQSEVGPILKAVAAEFEADAGVVERDGLSFLETLLERGVLEEVSGGDGS